MKKSSFNVMTAKKVFNNLVLQGICPIYDKMKEACVEERDITLKNRC
mgnify:CR=1 FL=1